MKFRLYLPLFLSLPLVLSAANSAENFRLGDDALSGELWEIATLHFTEALKDPTLPAERKPIAAIRLSEALIRGGKPAEALTLLSESFLQGTPGLNFWKGQALTALHRFSEAADALSAELSDEKSPYKTEAALTQASLRIALDQPDAALRSLAGEAPALKLRRAEILFDLNRYKEARAALPKPEDVAESQRPNVAFLEASLLLAEGEPADAASRFAVLLSQREGLSLVRFHATALGMADALAATGNPKGAAESLLVFIQENPDSPLLEAMFDRLIDWLPAVPAANDPIMDKLAAWIPPSDPASAEILESSAATRRLAALALFARATGLHRMGTAAARQEATELLNRLRRQYPESPSASRALIQRARWLLDDGQTAQAFAELDATQEMKDTGLQGEALFLKARLAYETGEIAKAAELFNQAASFLTEPAAHSARLNAALSQLREGAALPILTNGSVADKNLQDDLELERALITKPPAAAKAAIEAFLVRHPTHPRVPEARLAVIEAALESSPPDLVMARAQLDALTTQPEQLEKLPPVSIAMAKLRIADLSNDPKITIPAARAFLEEFPQDPAAAEASLTLGRNLFQTGDYNDARLVLEKLALSDPQPVRAQAARFLAAQSAALVATPQSREEALALFDQVIAAGGPIVPIATMEKARLMIDSKRIPEAIKFLRKWFDSLPKDDPLRLPAGLLLGDAYAQDSGSTQSLAEALAVYDQLLVHAKTQPALLHRLQYFRGMALEQLPQPGDSTKKRENEAFIVYHSVLEAANNQPPAEWEYFERCGFRALELLEKAERWEAAVKLARKIASFGGPKAKDAADRARQLQLKHMLWED
jgi:tetratricopeptide (TPR) repeat protein